SPARFRSSRPLAFQSPLLEAAGRPRSGTQATPCRALAAPARRPPEGARNAGVHGEAVGMTSRAYGARRAPRRRVQRRVGRSRIRWDRVGRIALVLVLFGVLVSYLNPLVNLVEAWQGSKSSEQQLTQLRQEQTQLRSRLREVSSPATLEREARRL